MTDFAMRTVLTKRIYSRSALDQVAEAFAKELRVLILREDDSNVVVSIANLNGGAPDDPVMRGFLNHLLEVSVVNQIHDAEGVRLGHGEALPRP